MQAMAILLAVTLHPWVSPGDEPSRSYTGRHAPVSYRYRTTPDGGAGGVSGFELETPSASLTGTITGAVGYARVVLTEVKSGATAFVAVAPSPVAGTDDVHLSFPFAGEDFYFESNAVTREVRRLADGAPDCEALSSSPLVRVLAEAADLLRLEVDSEPRPPGHLVEVAAAVLYTDALLQIGGCARDEGLRAAGCYYDTSKFEQCVECCDRESNAVGVVCGAGVLIACGSSACNKLGAAACTALVELSEGVCVAHNCGGKPGNPGCRDPKPPCPGMCIHFCGPGWSSTCGECPAGRECCS